MVFIVIAFLWVSLAMYLIFGGADFGAGILELVAPKKIKPKLRQVMYKSIGPIWEANHMWLIIAIVILFVGFPEIYATVSEYLHIPLVIMLLGIVARGTSFVFRNYDVSDDHLHKLYSNIFTLSSFITPLFLGIIAGATVSGSIDNESKNFLDAYIFSWLTFFNVGVGLFTVSICGFLAAIYSLESLKEDKYKRFFKILAFRFTLAIFISGGFVFIISVIENIPLLSWIFASWIGYVSVFIATIGILFLNLFIKNDKDLIIRVIAVVIVVTILLAVSYSHFPNIILFKNGSTLTLLPENLAIKTINDLALALLLGSVFILPFLFYLIYSFNKNT